MNYTFFQKLGISKIQTDIYLALYKLGSQPASVIAKYMGFERIRIYRNLLSLVKLGIVKKSQKNGIQLFFIGDIKDLEKIVENKENDLIYIKKSKDEAISEIKKQCNQVVNTPKITLYDSSEGVGNIFEDILDNIKKQNILTIKLFASNTIEERNDTGEKVGEYASSFFKKLESNGIFIDQYIGVGNLLMERLKYFTGNKNLNNLPASSSSVNIFLVGSVIYFIVYNKAPIGIKIENENLSNVLHFLLKKVKNS